jgi:GAF domain-containing protein
MLTSDRTSALSRHSLHALYEAHRVVTSDLSLGAMLSRIVLAGCELIGAPHGALAPAADIGGFGEMLQLGNGRAVADAVLADASWTALTVHTDPSGTQVASVPLLVRGEPFAMLVLSAPDGGRPFDADDEEVLDAFAAATATAVENALLYDDARRSRDWLNASGEIARALLADADDDTLFEVVSRALYVAEADTVSLVLPTTDDMLEVAVTVGVGSRDWEGVVFDPHNSLLGRAITRGESLLIPDLVDHARAGYINAHHFGPTMLAPLIDAKGVRGAVVLLRMAGRPRFTAHDLDLATTFADQVALAFELNDTRAEAESLRAVEERDRLAQDLHDSVIQRLFATGVGLQGLANSVPSDETVARLRAHIADLDATIDEIRERVFGLRCRRAEDVTPVHHRVPRVATSLPAN